MINKLSLKIQSYILFFFFFLYNISLFFYSPINNQDTGFFFLFLYIIFPIFTFLSIHKDILYIAKKDYYDYAVVLGIFTVAIYISKIIVELYISDFKDHPSNSIFNILIFMYVFMFFVFVRMKPILMLNVLFFSINFYFLIEFFYSEKSFSYFNIFYTLVVWMGAHILIRHLIKYNFSIRNNQSNIRIKRIKNNFLDSFVLSLFLFSCYLNITLYLKDYINFNLIYEDSYCSEIKSNVKILKHEDNFYIDKKQFLYYDVSFDFLNEDKYYKYVLDKKKEFENNEKIELFFNKFSLLFNENFPNAFKFEKVECRY